jgi:DNA-binding NtrC family response regulator
MTETAAEAVRRGAFGYLVKPLDLHRLRDMVCQAIDFSRQPCAATQAPGQGGPPDRPPEGGRPPAAAPVRLAAPAAAFDVAQFARDLLRAGQSGIYHRVLAAVERVVLPEVLHGVGGNQVRASQLLGISRTTLRRKLQGLGYKPHRPPRPPERLDRTHDRAPPGTGHAGPKLDAG